MHPWHHRLYVPGIMPRHRTLRISPQPRPPHMLGGVSGSPPPKRTPREQQAADPDDDRPTLVPEFDPDAFARDSEIRQRSATALEGESAIDQARRFHRGGDHEQALFLVTRLLELEPLHPEAMSLSVECRAALERECLAAVGSESTVLTVAITADELKRFALDHVSGFLLSLTDGSLTVEAIVDASGLPRLLALRHLRNLLDRGIVSVASGYRRPTVPESARSWADREQPVDDDGITIENVIAPSNAHLDAVPVLLVPRDSLDVLGSDTPAWRVLSLVDDTRTVHEILTLTKTEVTEGIALFERLAGVGLVALL
jgi:hypothetical protein